MPRIEFKSETQREKFIDWMDEKCSGEIALRIEGENPTWQGDGFYEVWQVGKGDETEPLVVFRNSDYGAIRDPEISEILVGTNTAKELREAGVLFEHKAPEGPRL